MSAGSLNSDIAIDCLRANSLGPASFRDGYLHYPSYGECLGATVHALGRAGGTMPASSIAASASTPSFLAGGFGRPHPRRYSQQQFGSAVSPVMAPGASAEPAPSIYVMAPLDTVNADGVFRYAGSAWFAQALQLLVSSGAHGVAMDFWWGAVEKAPGQYNWAGYKQALEVIKQTGLKVQVVLSFHACGGNVGDTVQIPLPDWVLQCGEADPDLFFADRPRNGGLGNRNREYISIWADDAGGVLRGRSPMQCYEDLMTSLRDNFSQEIGTVIDEVVVGAGPCGELRLPSYVEANGWRFPGAGEFQCYDRRALASLAQAAREAGHPEWGYTGPHDAGEYNSLPENTGFFSNNGSWNTPYGRFFLSWYSKCLLKHGDRLLGVANAVFATKLAHYVGSAAQLLQPQALIPSLGSAGSALALQLQQASQHSGSLGSGPHSALVAHPGIASFVTATTVGGMHHSGSYTSTPFQPVSFLGLHSSQTSSGGPRMSSMSLNRILETGSTSSGSGSGTELAGNADGCAMPPPSGPPPRRQVPEGMLTGSSVGAASASPYCTYSSISAYTAASNFTAASNMGAGMAAMMAMGGSSGSLVSPRVLSVSNGAMHGALHGEPHGGSRRPGSSGGNGASNGGGGQGMNGALGAAVGAAAARDVDTEAVLMQGTAAAPSGAGPGIAAGATRSGGVGSGSSSSNTSGSGTAMAATLVSSDASMIDVEPSDNSHTSAVIELLNAPPRSSSGTYSGLLCHSGLAPPAGAAGVAAITSGPPPSSGPSPISATHFRSSASTLADSTEPMYGGQGTTFAAAAAAAAGVLIASGGGTARMDLCNSLSSLSTEFTTTGGGGGGGHATNSMLYLDVAASLVADGDDESEIGTSCCTGGAPEDADELFAMAAAAAGSSGRGGHGCLSEHGGSGSMVGVGSMAMAPAHRSQHHHGLHHLHGTHGSMFSDDGRRGSVELGMGLGVGSIGVGMGGADAAAGAGGADRSIGANPMASLLSPTASCSAVPGSSSGGGGIGRSGGGGIGNGNGGGLHLALKIAGIHWWYRSRSHAAELTAGYYNVDGHDGYEAIINLCARHRANLVLTCVEMCDSQHPTQAQCGPEGLLRQLRQLAARAGVSLSGENALPIFSTGGVDSEALDRIAQNMRAWPAPSLARGISPAPSLGSQLQASVSAPASSQHAQAATAALVPSAAAAPAQNGIGGGGNIVCIGYRMSDSGRMVPVGLTSNAVNANSNLNFNGLPQPQQEPGQQGPGQQQQQQPASCVSRFSPAELQRLQSSGYLACPSPAAIDVLPALRAFTFLRLVPEMLLPGYQGLWMRFMGKLMAS